MVIEQEYFFGNDMREQHTITNVHFKIAQDTEEKNTILIMKIEGKKHSNEHYHLYLCPIATFKKGTKTLR